MKNWDKILDDFARKCKGGAPDMTNPRHLALLRESLLKFGWKKNATNEFIGNLRTLQVLREPLVEAGGGMPAGKTDAGTPLFWVTSADGKKIGKRTKQTKTMPKWASQDHIDKNKEKEERDKKEKENQAKADAIHKGIYGKKKGMLEDTSPDADGDGRVKQEALDKGFKKGAEWNAPGGSASLFNEILSGEGAAILDEWEKKHPGEEVPEEVLAEILMKQFGDTASAQQQAGTGAPFVTADDIPDKYKSSKKGGKYYDNEGKEITKDEYNKREQRKDTYSKALLTARSAKRKHERGKRAVATVSGQKRKDGKPKFGKVKKTHHFYGATDSITKQKEMIDRVAKDGGKIYAPDGTEIDPEDLKWWIDAGGGGANPTDTAQFVEDEDGNLVIMFASDKTTTADIQDNSTLAQEIKDRKARIDEIDPKDMSSDDENQSGEEAKEEAQAEVDRHQGLIDDLDNQLKETTIPAATEMKNEDKGALSKEWDDNPDTTEHWETVRAAFRGGTGAINYQKHLPGWPDGKGRPAPNEGKSYEEVPATDDECVEATLNKVSKGEGSGTDAKIITRSSARIQKGGSDIPKNDKYDMQKQISAIRKKIVKAQRLHKNRMDKYKVNGVPLGNLLEARQASSALHFGMLDSEEDEYKPPPVPPATETEEQKEDRIQKGMMGHGMFEANMGGTVVNREVLEECLGADSVSDVEKNFQAVKPGKKDRYTKDPNGNITGRVVFIYVLKKGKATSIGYKTYRPKSGKVGKTSNTMQYTPETQECFAENQHLVTN